MPFLGGLEISYNIVKKLLTFSNLVHSLAGDAFRHADGSCNSLQNPDVGKSNSHYARTVTTKVYEDINPPDPSDIFDLVMDRANQKNISGKEFIPHPNGIRYC